MRNWFQSLCFHSNLYRYRVGTTYAISLAHGDAPVIPMISDTFVKAPESYVSRLGIVTVATLLQLIVWFLHSYLCAFAAPTRAWRCFTLLHSLAGALGSLALGLVGRVGALFTHVILYSQNTSI